MTAQFTMYLKDYLAQGYTLPLNIDDFITLDIAGKQYNVRESFIKRFSYREIGCETQELFKIFLEVSIDEALAQFNPQLQLLQDSYVKLMQRTENETVTRTEAETSENSANITRENKEYLNPANIEATKLQSKTENTDNGTGNNKINKNITENKEKATLLAKSNAEVLKLSYEVVGVFNKILDFLSRNFIGLY